MRKLHSVEGKGLLMQYHSINIKKTAEAIKKWRWSVEADFKIIISQKFNAFESNHSDESDIGGIHIPFLKKHFSAEVY